MNTAFLSLLLAVLDFFLFFLSFFLVALGLCSYERAFSSCGKQGLLSSCGVWALTVIASLVAELRL